MPVQWRPAMSIDGATIDDDHQHLIRLFNNVAALCDAEFDRQALLNALGALKYYTVYHFVREEAAQRASSFPDCAHHTVEHKQVVESVKHAIDLVSEEIQPERYESIRREIMVLLRGWLITHILKHDMSMRPFIRNSRAFMGRSAPLSTV